MWGLITALRTLIASLTDNSAATRANTTAVVDNSGLTDTNNSALAENSAILLEQIALQKQIIELLTKLLAIVDVPPDPGPISLLITGENGNMLNFKINLPPLANDPDIVSGELSLKIGDADATVIPTTKDQTVVDNLAGEQGALVIATFAYVDDADNRSAHPSALSIVLTDTIPPADPGSLSLEVTSET